MFKKGHVPWNRGLTKENDSRIKKYAIKTGIASKRRGAKPPSRKGIKHSKETRKKLSISHRGNRHWNWQGGKSKLRNRMYYTIQYQNWRRSVFERDNYICRKCGLRSGLGKKVILQAHHRKEVHKILKENKIKTLRQALKCKELWDVDNGDTLCEDCHRKTLKFVSNQFSK